MNTTDDNTPENTTRPFGFWLKAVDRLMADEFASAFEGEEIGRRDWRLLNIVDGTIPARRPLNTHKLHRLVERGWVAPEGDGWKLTDDGREAKDRLGAIVDGIRTKIGDAVSDEEMATTLASLEKIARAFGWDEETPLPRGRRHGFGGRGHGRFPKHFGPRHGFGRRRGFGPASDGGTLVTDPARSSATASARASSTASRDTATSVRVPTAATQTATTRTASTVTAAQTTATVGTARTAPPVWRSTPMSAASTPASAADATPDHRPLREKGDGCFGIRPPSAFPPGRNSGQISRSVPKTLEFSPMVAVCPELWPAARP